MTQSTDAPSAQLDADTADPDDDLLRTGRNAAATRNALVRAARRRFATDGYRATTVRGIAADAGVNVALINRYFESKEGLFEACMLRTSDELESTEMATPRVDGDVVERLISYVSNTPNRDAPLQLLLLLRSSGDENADAIRRRSLERFTRKLATMAGWSPDDIETTAVLLQTQVAIATLLGVVMLRSSAAVEPMASASRDDLAGPLGEVLRAMLAARPSASG
jgi:AcrR family transcriptional regulator